MLYYTRAGVNCSVDMLHMAVFASTHRQETSLFNNSTLLWQEVSSGSMLVAVTDYASQRIACWLRFVASGELVDVMIYKAAEAGSLGVLDAPVQKITLPFLGLPKMAKRGTAQYFIQGFAQLILAASRLNL